MFATFLGAGTVVLAVAVSLPQLVRLVSGGTAAGVSLPAATNSAISFVAWTGYALHVRDVWLVASSAIGVPFAVATAVAAWRLDADRAGLWLPVAWASVLGVAATVEAAGGAGTTGALVGASIAWLLVPAIVTAWRSPDVTGLSPTAWLMLALEGGLFLGYGLASGVRAPVLYGICALTGSAAVLARLPLGELDPAGPDRLRGILSCHIHARIPRQRLWCGQSRNTATATAPAVSPTTPDPATRPSRTATAAGVVPRRLRSASTERPVGAR
ncbi:hypothetical protein ACIB24_04445 [Spongisporangium articulatum]|uniref:Uncharacterized protein n=1 Tax=Spongisporangium articulatum TaxID=3362603 RepID=A0ABW8AIV5_9ACTN